MRSRLPPLKTLPVFVAVAKHLSFSKAAAELSLTHSAVSQAVKQLENFFGCKLLQRSTNHVALTKQGLRYLTDIDAALQQIHGATMTAKQATQWLNVNLMTSLALHWLIPRLPEFQQAHKTIKVNLSTTAQPLLSALERQEIDIVITTQTTSLKNDAYHCVQLWTDELVLVASPKLIKSQSKYSKRSALCSLLQRYPAIDVDAPSRKQNWHKWCQAKQIAEPVEKSRYLFPTTTQAIQAAISGVGLLVTHKAFVQDNIAYGLLKSVVADTVKTKQHYYMLMLSEKMHEAKFESFANFVESIMLDRGDRQ